MIKYALICGKGHEFESWFPDSAAYDKQVKKKLVTCPICNSSKIEKAIMAPRLSKGRARSEPLAETPASATPAPATAPVAMVPPQEAEFRNKLRELRDHLINNADNVGTRFPEEARKMHYGEIEHRSIYGEASAEEAEKMLEEGIEFHPIPVLPEDRN